MLENEKLREVSERRKSEQPAAAERYNDTSRRRLLRIIEKKLTTSFIGALSKFETFFGHIWGHGKEVCDLTPEEVAWRDLWDTCRTEVLNNGNNQLRAVQSEIVMYTIHWDRHNLVLPAVASPPQSPDQQEKETGNGNSD